MQPDTASNDIPDDHLPDDHFPDDHDPDDEVTMVLSKKVEPVKKQKVEMHPIMPENNIQWPLER